MARLAGPQDTESSRDGTLRKRALRGICKGESLLRFRGPYLFES